MKASPTSRNLPDFKQRYQGVQGWLLHKEQRMPVYVHQVSSAKVTFRDANDAEYYANVDGGGVFEFMPCKRQFYNLADSTILMMRIPARQYRRGMCPDNTQVLLLTSGDMSSRLNSEEWRRVVFEVMSKTVDYPTAFFDYLAGKRKSVALSPFFGITDNKVFFLTLNIGTIKGDSIVLNPVGQSVQQELTDCIRRNKYPLKVA